MLTRRAALQTLAAGLASGFSASAQTARKPNLIILLADDLGYGDVGCFGSPDVPTPHIDSIAASGVRCTDGYVTNAVCSPSRAAILTGRYQHRYGHEFNPGPARRDEAEHLGLPLSETLLPKMLKKAGYSTGMVGKWHLGGNPEFHPMSRGFDEFFGFLHGANSYVTTGTGGRESVDAPGEPKAGVPDSRVQPIFRGRKSVEESDYLTDAFTREAVGYIDRHKRDPFFLYLAFNAVHTPLQATAKYLDRFANIPNPRHRMLAAMTSAMDDGIGKVLGKLKESGLEKDTLIFFLADNGCPIYTGAGSNRPLNGSKCTLYEGGIRVPFAMQWPGRIKPGQVYRKTVSSLDMAPTFLNLAGAASEHPLDGVDLLPYVTGKNSGAPNEKLFWRMGRNSAARIGNWKLIQIGDKAKLYDLATDIGEKKDLAAEKPEVVRDLTAAWKAWNAPMVAPLWKPRGTPEIPINGEKITWDI
jgi:arylsulfatase A-like enzyme